MYELLIWAPADLNNEIISSIRSSRPTLTKFHGLEETLIDYPDIIIFTFSIYAHEVLQCRSHMKGCIIINGAPENDIYSRDSGVTFLYDLVESSLLFDRVHDVKKKNNDVIDTPMLIITGWYDRSLKNIWKYVKKCTRAQMVILNTFDEFPENTLDYVDWFFKNKDEIVSDISMQSPFSTDCYHVGGTCKQFEKTIDFNEKICSSNDKTKFFPYSLYHPTNFENEMNILKIIDMKNSIRFERGLVDVIVKVRSNKKKGSFVIHFVNEYGRIISVGTGSCDDFITMTPFIFNGEDYQMVYVLINNPYFPTMMPEKQIDVYVSSLMVKGNVFSLDYNEDNMIVQSSTDILMGPSFMTRVQGDYIDINAPGIIMKNGDRFIKNLSMKMKGDKIKMTWNLSSTEFKLYVDNGKIRFKVK